MIDEKAESERGLIMARISVIVPVYKVELYLRRCVDSILAQTFTDFDLILIDDESPDQCPQICKEYASTDSRIHIIHHNKNLGLSAARNSGIDWAFTESDSEWIAFVDSDDWVHPLYLEALFYAAQNHGVSVCYRSRSHGEDLPPVQDYSISTLKTEDYYLTYMGNSTVAWGKLFAKELFDSMRFPVGKYHEDEFVIYRLLFQFKEVPFIPQPLYFHLINPDGIMRRTWTPRRLDVLEAFEAQLDFFALNGYTALAENRFRAIIKTNKSYQRLLYSYQEIADKDRKKKLEKLHRQIQRVLIRYRKYRWLSIWNRGEDLWIYSDAFFGVHVLHMLWRSIKSFRHSRIGK